MPAYTGKNLSGATIKDAIHLYFLLDNSASMSDRPIESLNEAMANMLPEIVSEARRREIKPIVHILAFSSSIRWLCGTTATHGIDASQITWSDIDTDSTTDTAGAIEAILPGLSTSLLGHHAFRPIIVLITDAYSDDRNKTIAAIKKLDARQKTIRIAIGVSGYNADELNDYASEATVIKKDIMENEIASRKQKLIFPVDNADALTDLIREVTISSLIASDLMGRQEPSGDKSEDFTIGITEYDPGKPGGPAPSKPASDPGGWIE